MQRTALMHMFWAATHPTQRVVTHDSSSRTLPPKSVVDAVCQAHAKRECFEHHRGQRGTAA